MLYLNNTDVKGLPRNWSEMVDIVETAVRITDSGHYAQPLKPYLRYNNLLNRLIAMPAYLGGSIHTAGLKWIASFPGNIDSNLPRAHSVIVLNDPDTGIPQAILNTPIPSILRTAAVSGLMIRHFNQVRPNHRLRIGIIGWGPIGQMHYEMCSHMFSDLIDQIMLYDIRGVSTESMESLSMEGRTRIAKSWQELYEDSDLIITCTASTERYIDREPTKGSFLLHVSLRDYEVNVLTQIKAVIVDDWQEVCRENTDIEALHLQCGLVESHTKSLGDVVCRKALTTFTSEQTVLFCPMGMAVFDIAIADYIVQQAYNYQIGKDLE